LYFLIAGDEDAKQWASGAQGAVIGQWLR
jgi:hypothetical protein